MTAIRDAVGLLLGGLAVVVLDFRVQGVDLLPDPLGFVLLVLAAARLANAGLADPHARARLTVAQVAWGVAALAAVPGALAETRRRTGVHLDAGPAHAADALVGLADVVGTALVLFVLAAHAAAAARRGTSDSLRLAAWLNLAVAPLPHVLVPLALVAWPLAVTWVMLLVAIGFAVLAYTVIALLRARDLPPVAPPPESAPPIAPPPA